MKYKIKNNSDFEKTLEIQIPIKQKTTNDKQLIKAIESKKSFQKELENNGYGEITTEIENKKVIATEIMNRVKTILR